MPRFAHLFCCSRYSLLRGTFSTRQLVEKAVLSGAKHVSLTDHRGLYGALPFQTAAKEAGIHPIFGASFKSGPPGAALVALARNARGYQSLCRLVTSDQMARPKGGLAESTDESRSLREIALENSEGVVFLTSDPDFARFLRPHVSPQSLFLEYFLADSRQSRQLTRQLVDLAGALDLRGVATNRVHFLEPADYQLHKVLAAIRLRKTVDTLADDDVVPSSCDFASEEVMARRFADLPDALRAAPDIAESCEVELPVGGKQLPRFQPESGESPEAYLRRLCEEAIPRLYPPETRAAARMRLDHELGVILGMGYASYFLVVWDMVRHAREQGIPTTGRGSAADSLVSYLLRFTHVDPIRHNLYFERFLNPARSTPPDIDIDLCWRRRDEVVDYVYQRWGAGHVAMISTHITFAGRSCVREVGKALGLSESEIERYTRFLPHYGAIDIEQLRRERPESRHLDFEAEPLRTIMPLAKRIEGFPWHLGVHPSGIVVSPHPLTRSVPLEMAAKGLVVTQYDMYPIEDLGLMKIDLLGQRSLSVIADVCAQVRRERDPEFGFRIADCGLGIQGSEDGRKGEVNPEEDSATCDLIEAGRTMGVFQIESPAMRGVLRKVKARDFETVTAASSVIRPGPKDSGMLRSWVRRHLGKEPVRYLHPALRDVLSETHGILVYQEDVLKVAQTIAGMTLARADQMRRSMSDKRPEQSFADMEQEFKEGAARNGVSPRVADLIWRQMRAFAGYAFCKAHSASYTVLSFQSAYLKTHYPAEFMAAVLANGGGFYDRAAYVSEARRLGLRIFLPSINRSDRQWTGRTDRTDGTNGRGGTDRTDRTDRTDGMDGADRTGEGEALGRGGPGLGAAEGGAAGRGASEGGGADRGWIRCGLEQIRDVRARTVEEILEERRRGGVFSSFPEALRRLPDVGKAEWDNLILCGACDDLLARGNSCGWLEQSDQSDQSDRSDRSDQSDKSDKSDRSDQSDASDLPGLSRASTPSTRTPLPPFSTRPQLLWFLDRWFGGEGRGHRGGEAEQLDLFDAVESGAGNKGELPGAGNEAAQRGGGNAGDGESTGTGGGTGRGGNTGSGVGPSVAGGWEAPALPEFHPHEMADAEARILDVWIRSHPLERFGQVGRVEPVGRVKGVSPASALAELAGRRARLVGWLVTSRRLRTSKGTYMKFLSLEDETAPYEAILFDKAYQKFGHLTLTRGPYLVEGRVEDDEGHCSLHVERLEVLTGGEK
jgi:DNA-directed DNA polymerase III PolC